MKICLLLLLLVIQHKIYALVSDSIKIQLSRKSKATSQRLCLWREFPNPLFFREKFGDNLNRSGISFGGKRLVSEIDKVIKYNKMRFYCLLLAIFAQRKKRLEGDACSLKKVVL
jgi:hypothetical protein